MRLKGQEPILIAGQTASGKSALAVELARQHDGIIINADSMQVYRQLHILTARPTEKEMQGVEHRLYGHIEAWTAYSVGQWLQDVERELTRARQKKKRPVIVGGTGLYFKALLEGLSPVPDISEKIRDEWRSRALDPSFDLHTALQERDPTMAERLRPSDRQRLARALEVFEETGKSLLHWQNQPEKPLLDPDRTEKICLQIDRPTLYERCDRRFDQMMQNGALEEVKNLLALNLPTTLPAMRALGVPPLAACLQGKITKEEAVERAKTQTRQFAKRQNTWLKSNMISWNHLEL